MHRIEVYPAQNGMCTAVVAEQKGNEWVYTDICETNAKATYAFIFTKTEAIMRGIWAEQDEETHYERQKP